MHWERRMVVAVRLRVACSASFAPKLGEVSWAMHRMAKGRRAWEEASQVEEGEE